MKKAELDLRREIIAMCQKMNATGLNQGTSGNISARFEDRMLITPSATPYDAMDPAMICSMPLDGDYGSWDGPLRPSTEWRFHLDIMRGRSDAGAIVHAHPTYCTTLAICRRDIPAIHYMMAAFGGTDVRCSGYARYGTAELSEEALKALEGRNACLLANHGSIAIGGNLEKAMWLAIELETIARQYYMSMLIGGGVVLSAAQIAETAEGFKSYGVQDDHKTLSRAPRRRGTATKAAAPAGKSATSKRSAAKKPAARKPRAKTGRAG